MFEWCSISVRTTRSPSRTFVRATRLIAPVAFGVKIVPRGVPPEPLRDPLARALELVGGLGGDRVDAAVDARAVVGVVARHRVDHALRRLRRRARVEVGDPAPQRRKLGGCDRREPYTAQGEEGVRSKGGTDRRNAVSDMVSSVGGELEKLLLQLRRFRRFFDRRPARRRGGCSRSADRRRSRIREGGDDCAAHARTGGRGGEALHHLPPAWARVRRSRRPNQVVSASASPGWVGSPTQATYPSGRISRPWEP